jgi:hypothetical protein
VRELYILNKQAIEKIRCYEKMNFDFKKQMSCKNIEDPEPAVQGSKEIDQYKNLLKQCQQ